MRISIVIPAFNEEDYLENCLAAIQQQTVKPDEIIIVDNNSTDGTTAIARSFPAVRLIEEKRQGLYFARQTGMQATRGDIICRIDADTVVFDDWLEQIKKAFADSNIMAASGPVGYHDMPCPAQTLWGEDMFLRGAQKANYKFLMGANMAIRREAWEKVESELCNEPFLFEDIDIAVHLADHKITPVYLPGMKAHVSARRAADSPIAFFRYIGGHSRTLKYHGKRALGAHYAELIFSLAYLIFKPLHMVYDPNKRRASWRYLLTLNEPRPDPMSD